MNIGIAYCAGSYGTYLTWCLFNLTSSIDVVPPFNANGNSHKFHAVLKENNQSDLDNFFFFHPKQSQDDSLAANLTKACKQYDSLIHIYPDENLSLLVVNNSYTKIYQTDWWEHRTTDTVFKDNLYQNAQNIWNNFTNSLKEAKYNFHLNRPQHKFLTDLILTKMEYDVNTVFFAIELTNMMGGMKEAKYTNDKDLISFSVNATEITYIYHLISKHKVKGLTKDAYTFSQILYRIGNISKIFNYY